MKNLCTIGTSILFILLILSACDDNKSNYPKNYVGFGKGIESYTVNRQSAEQDINIKIITAEKSSKDREVTLSSHWTAGIQAAGYPNHYSCQKEISHCPHSHLSQTNKAHPRDTYYLHSQG